MDGKTIAIVSNVADPCEYMPWTAFDDMFLRSRRVFSDAWSIRAASDWRSKESWSFGIV
jgi:hypothetical protein